MCIGHHNGVRQIFVAMSICLFSAFTVSTHVVYLGFDYLESGGQIIRHQAVLDGSSYNPWQYRVLSEYLAEGAIVCFKHLGVSRPNSFGFIFTRFVLGVFVFLSCYFFYKKLGFSFGFRMIGLSVFAWGMSYAIYDSDLSFNTHMDILFYLLAAYVILDGRIIWIIPITFFAAFNRETSGLIPIMALAYAWPFELKHLKQADLRVWVPIMSLVLYLCVFVFLRYVFGSRPLFIPYEQNQGIDLLLYNLFRPITWGALFATLGIVPVLAVLAYQKWSYPIRRFFWGLVPVWFCVHFLGSVVAESRLFLVPHVLVFIPGALYFLLSEDSDAQRLEK